MPKHLFFHFTYLIFESVKNRESVNLSLLDEYKQASDYVCIKIQGPDPEWSRNVNFSSKHI